MVRLDGFLFLKYEIIMRINTKFKLRDIAGETIIVNQGTPEADLTRIISLNTSARLLWNELSDKDFLIEDAAEILMEHYSVSEETAKKDATVRVDHLGRDDGSRRTTVQAVSAD